MIPTGHTSDPSPLESRTMNAQSPSQAPSHRVTYPRALKSWVGLLALLLASLAPSVTAWSQEAQTLSWTSPSTYSLLLLGKTYPLTATSSSGLPVIFSVRSGPASISGGQLVATNVGMITVVAEQSGDATHAPVRVERRFNRSRHILEKESVWPESERGFPWDLAVSGQRAYVAEDYVGIQILDVSQPGEAPVLGTWRGLRGGSTSCVQCSGSTVFVSDESGIQILDASDPANIRQIGTYEDAGGGAQFSVSGSRLAIWSSPTVILDISDPAKPVKLGELDSEDMGVVQEGLAYIKTSGSSLRIVDLRTSGSIRELGRVEALRVGEISGIAVQGSIAHVVGQMGYAMVDATNLAKPREAAFFKTTHEATGVGVHGARVVVSGPDGRCQVLDISDPSAIREIWVGAGRVWSSGIPTWDGKAFVRYLGSVVALDLGSPGAAVQVFSRTPLSGRANGLGVLEGHVWLADNEGGLKAFAPGESEPLDGPESSPGFTYVLDRFGDRMVVANEDAQGRTGLDVVASSAGLPSMIVGSWRADHPPGLAQGVVIAGDHAYVVGDGLNVYDIRDPRTPKWVGTVESRQFDAGAEWGLQVVGKSVYFSDLGGVYRLDSTTPSRPPEPTLERIGMGPVLFKVSPDGQRLHCLIGTTFEVWDIQNAASPKLLGSTSMADSWVQQLEVDGGTAWLRGTDSIQVLDISNPAAIKTLPVIASPTEVVGMTVNEGTLYLSNQDGLQLLDVRNPAEPKPLGQTSGIPSKILVQGGTAFLFDEFEQLSVLDVSDPKNIRPLPGYKSAGLADLDVSGNRIALAAEGMGLVLLERADDGSMTSVGASRWSGEARRVRVSGNRAYIAEESAGVRIISLEDPTQPKEIGWLDTLGSPIDIAVEGTRVYVATPQSGIQVFDVTDAAKPRLAGGADAPMPQLQAVAIQTVGTKAYVAYQPFGLQVLDISEPAHPKTLNYVPEFMPIHVDVVGDLAFLISGGGVQWYLSIFDVSQPTEIVRLDSIALDIRDAWGSEPNDLEVVGDRIHIAAGLDGVLTYRLRADDRQLQHLNQSLPSALAIVGTGDTGRGMTGDSLVLPGLDSEQTPTYRVVSGPARIDGDRLVADALGTVVIQITAPGNLQFHPLDSQRTIEIEAVPVLKMTRSGQTLTIAEWPYDYVLQHSPTLSPPDWQDAEYSGPVEVPVTEAGGYFRLHRAP